MLPFPGAHPQEVRCAWNGSPHALRRRACRAPVRLILYLETVGLTPFQAGELGRQAVGERCGLLAAFRPNRTSFFTNACSSSTQKPD
jgi:hypothetical protein